MNTFVIILLTLVMLSILIVLHELGHFIAAKVFGVYVIEFAIGMGPKLFSIQGKETLFSFRALPIGGFCRMYGESERDDEGKDDIPLPDDLPPERDFRNRPKRQRLVILLSGVAMNFLFALVCLFFIYLFLGADFGKALRLAPMTAWDYGTSIITALSGIFTGGVTINDFAGPVGMVSMVEDAVQNGFVIFLAFMSYISVNLGVINLLPLPALDGGQALVLIVEKIIGKDVNKKVLNFINTAGLALLMGLMVMITANDVFRLAGV